MISPETAPPPSPKDLEAIVLASRKLAPLEKQALHVSIEESHDTLMLPASVVHLISDLLTHMSQGRAVSVVPHDQQVTTQQAAELLGVSRPFVVRQMKEGHLPFIKIGTHRRIKFADVLAHKRKMREESDAAMRRLSEIEDEMGMDD